MQLVWVFHSVFGKVCCLSKLTGVRIQVESASCISHYRTVGLTNLHLISSKESCCSFPQTNGLPFLVKSYIGFNNFCSSGQNMLRKLTIPAKLLHPFTVVGVVIFELLLIYFSKVVCKLFCFE